MMVLEGPQGIRKSSVCRILGDQWYADPKMDIQKKESIEVLKGKWIIEFAEMEAMSKADTSALKAYITRVSDRYRAAYGRIVEDYPRHCIFIGTINPQRSGYLKDSTGNRRYWPIQIRRTVDTDALQNNVDQLWAEAYQVYLTREEPLYMKDSILDKVAREEVEKRQIRDPWVDVIRDFLNSKDINEKRREFVTLKDVYEDALSGVISRLNKTEHSRILDALGLLGWSEGYFQNARGFRPTAEEVL